MENNNEFIWGKNPAIELIRAQRRPALEIYVQKNRTSEYKPHLSDHRFKMIDKGRLNNLLGRNDHQGIAVLTTSYPYADFHTMTQIQRGLVLLVEKVTDPGNLGSIVRSAWLLGCSGIVISQKNASPMSPVACHRSAGASEHAAVARAVSIRHAISELQKKDFTVLGTAPPERGAVDIRSIQSAEKMAIVMGSEGEGLSMGTMQRTDQLVSIPQMGKLDSYGVAVATSLACYELANKMGII